MAETEGKRKEDPPQSSAILDTGPLVGILSERDQYHRWAREEAGRYEAPFLSCEAVISEAHFLLSETTARGPRALRRFVASGRIDLSFSYAEHVEEVAELMDTYENVPMSFADACLVRLAELHPKHEVFVTDTDFLIYRTRAGEPLHAALPG